MIRFQYGNEEDIGQIKENNALIVTTDTNKFFTKIDGQVHQISDPIVVLSTADPDTFVSGKLYYERDTEKMFYFNGTTKIYFGIDEELTKRVDELFISVSDGKRSIASAITDKGIQTADASPFMLMSRNIRDINQNGAGGVNVHFDDEAQCSSPTLTPFRVKSQCTKPFEGSFECEVSTEKEE